MKLYNLMYVDLDEKRVISRKTYTNNERVDLYLKGSCVLDRSLKINNMGGVKLLTNNKSFIEASLRRIGNEELEVVEIPFSLNVPKGIPFYSAHYKVDVFRYLATLPEDEYSILLDSDVVCMREFSAEYYELIKQGVPSVYYLNAYGGDKKLKDVRLIVEDIDWMPWAGGEFVGGTASFIRLYMMKFSLSRMRIGVSSIRDYFM